MRQNISMRGAHGGGGCSPRDRKQSKGATRDWYNLQWHVLSDSFLPAGPHFLRVLEVPKIAPPTGIKHLTCESLGTFQIQTFSKSWKRRNLRSSRGWSWSQSFLSETHVLLLTSSKVTDTWSHFCRLSANVSWPWSDPESEIYFLVLQKL